MTIKINNVSPKNGYIYIKDDKAEEKTVSGIVLPEERLDEDIKQGTVLSVSNKILEDGGYVAPEVKPGDTVLYGKVAGGGRCFEQDNVYYRLLVAQEILAVVE